MPRHIDVILKEKTALLAKINNFNKLMANEPLNKEYYAKLIITAKTILDNLEKEIEINPNPKVAITITPDEDANNLGSSGGKRQKKRKSKKHMKSKKTTKGKAKKTRRKSTRRRR